MSLKCFRPLLCHAEKVKSVNAVWNKWFLNKGAKVDAYLNLKSLLNWYQILSVEWTTWLFVRPERLDGIKEVSRAIREDESHDCASESPPCRSTDLNQNEICEYVLPSNADENLEETIHHWIYISEEWICESWVPFHTLGNEKWFDKFS